MKRFFPVAAVALSFLALLSPGALLAQDAPAPTVTVLTAQSQEFIQKVRLPGRIKASTIAEVRPQVSGIIRERLFDEGTSVEKGQPLYKIEDETYAAAVAAARAAVSQAEANFSLAEREARRAEELLATKTGSVQKRDTAVFSRDAAGAALQLAKAQLLSAEIDLERTTIRAPISGRIGLSLTTTGALVGAQQAGALSTIRALDPVYVDVTQSVNDLLNWDADPETRRELMAGGVEMMLPNGKPFGQRGELRAAEPQVEPTTGMITLRISFPNPDFRLLPGLYVEVEVPQARAGEAFLLPKNAVMRNEQGEAHAWLVEDGTVVMRKLTIQTGAGNDWVVTGGIKAGDKIVTSGFQKIAPGARVEIVEAPQTQAALVTRATEKAE
ncbi:hemolysin D [Paracoccus halophilus]|nr:efflux RND transporter periplasmic adaptor subunit [Paracoccus halophilus]KGJ05619.1 hemolysin D [Paracoccus halophilus]